MMSNMSTRALHPRACCLGEARVGQVSAGGQGRVSSEGQGQLAEAAHELRTPLAALRLELEEALTHWETADPHAALKGALRGAERLENAVLALLGLVQLAAPHRTPGDHPARAAG
ncbi:histidine kinase dimerization/phospho-acceptor domain-containing protein [Spirillospora sp. CA-108201]